MNIQNQKLDSVNNNITDIFSDFKLGSADETALKTKASFLLSQINSEISYINSRINKAKYPYSSQQHSMEAVRVGEMQKMRAIALKDAPLPLVKLSLGKELKLGNYEFCYELIELIFAGDRSNGDKANLSKEYSELNELTHLGTHKDDLKQAHILKTQIETVLDSDCTSDAVNKAEMVRAGIEMKYENKKTIALPEYQTYNE